MSHNGLVTESWYLPISLLSGLQKPFHKYAYLPCQLKMIFGSQTGISLNAARDAYSLAIFIPRGFGESGNSKCKQNVSIIIRNICAIRDFCSKMQKLKIHVSHFLQGQTNWWESKKKWLWYFSLLNCTIFLYAAFLNKCVIYIDYWIGNKRGSKIVMLRMDLSFVYSISISN